jgi:FkbM family methyltransferase
MKLSYAQNLEDVYLHRLFEDVPHGSYVDVGGGHPVADNVSFHAYLKGWSGLIVEPQARLAKLYASIRPRDRVETRLAGRASGTLTFHEIEGLHGFSTSVASHAERAVGDSGKLIKIEKPVARLADMIKDAGLSKVDFLKIDVEGAEADVLAGLGHEKPNAVRPRVILVEAIEPGTMKPAWDGWEPLLTNAGYRFAFFDNLNRYYVAEEAKDLAKRFPKDILAWDSVAHLWDMGRALETPEHPDAALANLLAMGLMAELPNLPPDLIERLIARGHDAQRAKDPTLPASPPLATLTGTAEQPAATTPEAARAAALGRIASMYDGGHLM